MALRRCTIRLGVILLIPASWDYFVYDGILFRVAADQVVPVRSV